MVVVSSEEREIKSRKEIIFKKKKKRERDFFFIFHFSFFIFLLFWGERERNERSGYLCSR